MSQLQQDLLEQIQRQLTEVIELLRHIASWRDAE